MPKSRTKSSHSAGQTGREVLQLVSRRVGSRRINGLVIGTVVGVDDAGVVRVDFAAKRSGEPVVARSTFAVRGRDVGREAALMFEGGNWQRPIIVGLIVRGSDTGDTRDVEVDAERFVFTAEREILLRCGKATITLTRAGKILIRGAYVLNRSSGVNRIKGGSVQIN